VVLVEVLQVVLVGTDFLAPPAYPPTVVVLVAQEQLVLVAQQEQLATLVKQPQHLILTLRGEMLEALETLDPVDQEVLEVLEEGLRGRPILVRALNGYAARFHLHEVFQKVLLQLLGVSLVSVQGLGATVVVMGHVGYGFLDKDGILVILELQVEVVLV
jgi:hypothetical protein